MRLASSTTPLMVHATHADGSTHYGTQDHDVSGVFADMGDGSDQNLRIRTAIGLVREGNLKAARVILQQERSEASPSILTMLGAIAVRMRRYEEGLEYLRQADRLTPNDPRVETLIATCYLGMKKVAAARRLLQQVVEGRNAPSDAFYYLALISRRDGAGAHEVVSMLQQCADRDPNHGDANFEVGTMLLDAARPGQAFNYLARAADSFPRDLSAQYNVALAAIQIGKFDVAERHLSVCQMIEPNQPDVLLGLAICCMEREDSRGAIVYMRRLCAISPTYQNICLQALTGVSKGSVALSTDTTKRLFMQNLWESSGAGEPSSDGTDHAQDDARAQLPPVIDLDHHTPAPKSKSTSSPSSRPQKAQTQPTSNTAFSRSL